MNRSVVSTAETALLLLCGLWFTIIIEGNAKLQSEVSEKGCYFFLIQITDPLKSIQGIFGRPWTPG